MIELLLTMVEILSIFFIICALNVSGSISRIEEIEEIDEIVKNIKIVKY